MHAGAVSTVVVRTDGLACLTRGGCLLTAPPDARTSSRGRIFPTGGGDGGAPALGTYVVAQPVELATSVGGEVRNLDGAEPAASAAEGIRPTKIAHAEITASRARACVWARFRARGDIRSSPRYGIVAPATSLACKSVVKSMSIQELSLFACEAQTEPHRTQCG